MTNYLPDTDNAVRTLLVQPGRDRNGSSPEIKSAAVSPEPREGQPVMQLAELAAFFGSAKRTAWRYTLRPDFPEPYAQLSTGQVWRRSDVERWQRKHNAPFPAGRPPEKKSKRRG